MNLAEIQAQVYDDLGYKSTPDALVVRRLLRYANDSQRSLVAMRGLARLRRSILTFASVVNSPFAVMPQAAVRIAGISERTSQRYLTEISIQQLRAIDPGLTNLDSNPSSYVVINMTAANAKELSAAAQIYVVSDNAGDVGTAYLQGVTTGGYARVSQVIMTGVTPAAFSPTDWIDITKFYLSVVAVGNVSITQGLAGTELSRIPVGRQLARYTKIQLYGTPSQALTYYADIDRHIEDFANAGDEPYLPEDYHWLIPTGIRQREYRKREKWQEYGIEKAAWTEGVSSLKAFCRSVTDGGSAGRSRVVDFNSPNGQIWPSQGV
jgi:hypothetical protein